MTQGKPRSGVTAHETGLGSRDPGTHGSRGGSVCRIKKTIGTELHFLQNCSDGTVGEWQRQRVLSEAQQETQRTGCPNSEEARRGVGANTSSGDKDKS